MGKPEDEFSFSTGGRGGVGQAAAPGSPSGLERECRAIHGFFQFKCLLVVLLGFAVFLSALFLLPPFINHSDLGDDPDLDPRFRGHEIVASFKLEKDISLLQDNIKELEDGIMDEIQVPNAKVIILSLQSSYESRLNITIVVFGIDPETEQSSLSSAEQSLIRDSFEYLVLNLSFLRLNPSLFGEAYFFQVLKFPGGITVSPFQNAFLLQKYQISFNFTLNFSIYQIRENFDELQSQLRTGLRLASYEILYISLINSRGSTVAPPVTVQSYVLMAVGITPSKGRLKQLAQTIKDSHGRNLGLNHTVFGKVKQVSLSSVLQRMLNGSDGGRAGSSVAPAPAPMLPSHHRHHHRSHHHHHNQGEHDPALAPASAPSPLPQNRPQPAEGPSASKVAETPPSKVRYARAPSCRPGLRKGNSSPINARGSSSAPAVSPKLPAHQSSFLPHPQAKPPAPVFRSTPSSSPLAHVILAHAYPPQSGSAADPKHGNQKASIAPSPGTSGAASWLLLLLAAFLLHRP